MKKSVLVLSILAVFSSSAYATNNTPQTTSEAQALGVGIGIAGAESSSKSSASADVYNKVSNSVDNKNIQGQNQSTENSNNASQSVNVGGNTTNVERAASTAYAPNNYPTATCMGSSSGGVQGLGFGISAGSSWTDSNCIVLEQVRTTVTVLKDPETAAEMMCSVKAYRQAREKVGRPCSK